MVAVRTLVPTVLQAFWRPFLDLPLSSAGPCVARRRNIRGIVCALGSDGCRRRGWERLYGDLRFTEGFRGV